LGFYLGSIDPESLDVVIQNLESLKKCFRVGKPTQYYHDNFGRYVCIPCKASFDVEDGYDVAFCPSCGMRFTSQFLKKNPRYKYREIPIPSPTFYLEYYSPYLEDWQHAFGATTPEIMARQIRYWRSKAHKPKIRLRVVYSDGSTTYKEYNHADKEPKVKRGIFDRWPLAPKDKSTGRKG
jgi:DNA-directed RNA polymerase subunit RPC12/RpoP